MDAIASVCVGVCNELFDDVEFVVVEEDFLPEEVSPLNKPKIPAIAHGEFDWKVAHVSNWPDNLAKRIKEIWK